jgi:ATP-binding cassette subfamily B protein
MTAHTRPRARRYILAPEVVQTSSMDCGPASLKCLLEGFGIPISYARLQEACQTDLDGTSINVIEQVAKRLGLLAEQIMIPVDHLTLSAAHALPALVVTRHTNNMLHFLVVWRRHGPFIQVMDPAKGRRWLPTTDFLKEIYVHAHTVPGPAWRQWAGSAEFLDTVNERLVSLGVSRHVRQRLAADATLDPDVNGLATLDAATRMVTSLVHSRAVRRGGEAGRLLRALVDRAHDDPAAARRLIPPTYWSVQPVPSERPRVEGPAPSERPRVAGNDGGQLRFRGAVLVRVRGRSVAASRRDTPIDSVELGHLSRDLVTAVKEPRHHPVKEVIARVCADGALAPAAIAGAVVLSAVTVLIEILLLRGFLEIGFALGVPQYRVGAMAALLVFVVALLLLDLVVGGGVLRLGRHLETRLRTALLDKLPHLGERYFQSRLISDMVSRAHALTALHGCPDLAARVIRSTTQLTLTALALAWLDPPSAPIAAAAAVLTLVIPLATGRTLAERDLRARTHAVAMSRFYLDCLLGLVPARTHGAERSLRRGHELLAVEWARSSLHLLRGAIAIEGIQSLAGYCLAAWLVVDYTARGGSPGGTLLLIYWALSLPALGRELAIGVQRCAAQRNVLARALEPLGAPDETAAAETRVPLANSRATPSGVAITFNRATVVVAGRPILHDITLAVEAGQHVAIVGRSGAGKSSLVGTLLGWNRPSAGAVLVDDQCLDEKTLANLRRHTAWVDPGIQLWNRSLFDNLRYGEPYGPTGQLADVIQAAELEDVLEQLPDGLQSQLGEGGALTSGGEGQRVRFGRALMRRDVRLVLMDEPFRGLDRQRRRDLLARARAFWHDATMVCVTHDISETRAFDRVLVVDSGRIVEDGNPIELANARGSLYAKLLAAEKAVAELWSAPGWRRLRVQDGAVIEDALAAPKLVERRVSGGGGV